MKNHEVIEDSLYDLALNARKKLNKIVSEFELLKLDIYKFNTDPILDTKLINLENQTNNQNIILKKFENEWM
jgi:hypothetical protein